MKLQITVKTEIDDALIQRLRVLLSSHQISTNAYDAKEVLQNSISEILSQGEYLLTDPKINHIFSDWLNANANK